MVTRSQLLQFSSFSLLLYSLVFFLKWNESGFFLDLASLRNNLSVLVYSE